LFIIITAIAFVVVRLSVVEPAAAAPPPDLIYTQQTKLQSADTIAGNHYGSRVAISGNWAAVGAPGRDQGGSDKGAVYLYQRTGQTWSFYQKLIAGDAAPHDQVSSVAIEGSTLVVGASTQNQGQGAVYVFKFAGGTWTEQQKLLTGDGLKYARFGSVVGISGQDDRRRSPWCFVF
jgi:hypothetical protein